jgi:hypothetical protein
MTTVAVALLACEHPKPRPPQPIPDVVAMPYDGGCEDLPTHRLVDSAGGVWQLAELRGHEIKRMTIADAEWFGTDRSGATLTACDLGGADLRGANLAGAPGPCRGSHPGGFRAHPCTSA